MINVRQAGEGDVEILVELNRFVQELHFTRMPRRFKPVETGAILEWFRSMIENPAVRALGFRPQTVRFSRTSS